MNTHSPESTPIELNLEELAQVGGAAPRGGWETDPPPEEAKAEPDTTPAAPAA